MERVDQRKQPRLTESPDLLQTADLPEVVQIAMELYARDRAQIERAEQRLELKRAAAEAGLPPDYLERAASLLQEQRHLDARRGRRRRRWWIAAALAVVAATGVRVSSSRDIPPTEAYVVQAGGPYGAPPGGYPGSPPGYAPPATPGGYPGGPPGYGPPGGPPGYGGPYVAPAVYPSGPLGAKGPFTGANLRGRDFNRGSLAGQNLSESNLRGARLTNGNLRGADLKRADLRGADLTGSDLAGAELDGATYDRHTRWPSGFDPAEHGARRVERGQQHR